MQIYVFFFETALLYKHYLNQDFIFIFEIESITKIYIFVSKKNVFLQN